MRAPSRQKYWRQLAASQEYLKACKLAFMSGLQGLHIGCIAELPAAFLHFPGTESPALSKQQLESNANTPAKAYLALIVPSASAGPGDQAVGLLRQCS